MNRTLFGILLIAVATPASAAMLDDGLCRNGLFPANNDHFGLAIVNGQGRAQVLDDMNGCPKAERRCRKGYYVVPGDRVVTGRIKGSYVCAFFPNKGGGTAGWIERSRLRPLTINRNPPQSAWIGRWSSEENPIMRIMTGHRGLRITGEAYWPGPTRDDDWPPGWPHYGNIDGKLVRQSDHAHYDADGCRVDLVLVGDTLIASDNEMCGGANVRFNGVYRRQKR